MHLRLPLVAGIVTLAAGAAFVRLHGGTSAPPVLAISQALPDSSARDSPDPRHAALDTARAGDVAIDGSALASNRRRIPRTREAPAVTIVVYVAGDVARPGLYTLAPRSRAADAVRAAGGAKDDADLVAVNLAAPIADGDEVAVLAKGADTAPVHRRARRTRASGATSDASSGIETSRQHRRHAKHRKHKKRTVAADSALADPAGLAGPLDLVDINAAQASELETLPGIGAALAERIVTVREASGPFVSADDLLDVGGMTQGRLDALMPYIVVR